MVLVISIGILRISQDYHVPLVSLLCSASLRSSCHYTSLCTREKIYNYVFAFSLYNTKCIGGYKWVVDKNGLMSKSFLDKNSGQNAIILSLVVFHFSKTNWPRYNFLAVTYYFLNFSFAFSLLICEFKIG